MNMLKPGDSCPLCGQPILTEDPEALLVLSEISDLLESKDRENEEREQ